MEPTNNSPNNQTNAPVPTENGYPPYLQPSPSAVPEPVLPLPVEGALRRRRAFNVGIVAIVLLVAFGVFLLTRSKASGMPPAVVNITANGFEPSTISVLDGQTVEWTNKDTTSHQPSTDPFPLENELAGFRDAVAVNPGDSYSFTFTKPGTYTYHDHLNPFTFKGTVIVK